MVVPGVYIQVKGGQVEVVAQVQEIGSFGDGSDGASVTVFPLAH